MNEHLDANMPEVMRAKCLFLGIRIRRSNLYDSPPRYLVLITQGGGDLWWTPSGAVGDKFRNHYFDSAQEAFDAYVEHLTQRGKHEPQQT